MKSNNQAGKTTCTFRISPETKLALATTAKELNMSPSQYIEALVSQQHNIVVNSLDVIKREKKITFSEPLYELVMKHLEKLKERHSDSSVEELIAGALAHAYSNKGAIWQRSLDTFIKRNSYHINKLENQES